MKQASVLVLTNLVFFIGLFLYRAILPGLLFAAGFFLLIVFLNKINSTVGPKGMGRFTKTVVNLILGAGCSLALYGLVYVPVEFLVTEKLLITPFFPKLAPVILLALLVGIFNFVDWYKLTRHRYMTVALIFILVFSGMVFGVFRREKIKLETQPKVYQISKGSGFQGEIVTVSGTNFMPAWKKGKIIIGRQEMEIVSWEDRKVIFTVGVPNKFGLFDLQLITKDGRESNAVKFEVKDPKILDIGY